LTNHRDVLAAMDFFTVPTLRFRLLYVLVVIEHDRRRVLHVNVTGADGGFVEAQAVTRLTGVCNPQSNCEYAQACYHSFQ